MQSTSGKSGIELTGIARYRKFKYDFKDLQALYGVNGLISFRLDDVEKNPENDHFNTLKTTDKYRIFKSEVFMGDKDTKIQKVEIDYETELIFVLGSDGAIYVLNHTLKNNEDGLIFKFRNPFFTSELLDFFLP